MSPANKIETILGRKYEVCIATDKPLFIFDPSTNSWRQPSHAEVVDFNRQRLGLDHQEPPTDNIVSYEGKEAIPVDDDEVIEYGAIIDFDGIEHQLGSLSDVNTYHCTGTKKFRTFGRRGERQFAELCSDGKWRQIKKERAFELAGYKPSRASLSTGAAVEKVDKMYTGGPFKTSGEMPSILREAGIEEIVPHEVYDKMCKLWLPRLEDRIEWSGPLRNVSTYTFEDGLKLRAWNDHTAPFERAYARLHNDGHWYIIAREVALALGKERSNRSKTETYEMPDGQGVTINGAAFEAEPPAPLRDMFAETQKLRYFEAEVDILISIIIDQCPTILQRLRERIEE